MRFIGVSTASSSINKVFPKWSELLDLNAELKGLDIPIGATSDRYRDSINEMRNDPNCVGALVTTHKIAVFDNAKDLFSKFDQFASACGEVSCVKIVEGSAEGAAKDPITAGLAIEEFLPRGYFKNGADVLIFGDGGAATAIAWYLTGLADPPREINFFGIDSNRLDHLKEVVTSRPGSDLVSTYISSAEQITLVLNNLSPGSLIINATGMGKDIPGSPMPNGVKFPKGSVIWELNYRGSLEFLKQAQSEALASGLKVHDGWRYFIHGWSSVVAEVFDINLTPELMVKLTDAAEIAK
ncbi:MAG: shikimate dehydrogenase [Actinomycetales bacterium]|nr:MAG: shikimate dehydrogenase [Actinomycetales bacterium]